MSILTPEEQIGFYRQKGFKTLGTAGLFLLIAVAYFFWFGPYFRDIEAGTRVNALFYSFYEAFGITTGGLIIAGISLAIAAYSLRHFSRAAKIKAENSL
jgi:hypothetical protein